MNKKIKQWSINSFLQYIFVFLTILQCNSVFFRQSETNHEKIVTLMWIASMLSLFVLAAVQSVKGKYNVWKPMKFVTIWGVVVVSFIAISYLRYPFSLTFVATLLIPVIMVPVFFVDFKNGSMEAILIKFKKLTVLLAIVSLFFWIFAIMGVHPTSSVVINWGNPRAIYGYYNVHYIAQGSITFLGIPGIIRNTGIFVEAPMYSYILCMALLVSIFLEPQRKGYSKSSLLLMITILTTTSSTGTIILVIIIFGKAIFLSPRLSNPLKSLIAICILPIVIMIIMSIVEKKMDTRWNSSTGIRLNDFVAGYNAWKRHMIMGNGINNYGVLIENMDYRRTFIGNNSGFSTGFMETLAYGGLAAASYYIAPLIALAFRNRKIFLMGAVTFVLFMFTLVNNVYLFYVFISYFWTVCLIDKK